MAKRTVAELEKLLAASERRAADAEARAASSASRLAEALEQQTATAEVLAIISRSPTDLPTVLGAIARASRRLCAAFDTNVWLRDGDEMVMAAIDTPTMQARLPVGHRVTIAGSNGPSFRAIREARTVHVRDLPSDPEMDEANRARYAAMGARVALSAPLLRGGEAIGVLSLRRQEPEPFSDQQIKLLGTFADQAVIAIENARLFQELNESNASLKEALEQQTATAEVLEVINRSPTELQTVLDTICQSAARLCGALDAILWQRDGDERYRAARYGSLAASLAVGERQPLSVPGAINRAIHERRVVHVVDVAASPDVAEHTKVAYARQGVRVVLHAPLLHGDDVIGTLSLRRTEERPFSEREIALVETFADQAAIAMENARLFAELQERNEDLAGSLAHERAVGQILRVINASSTDMQPVFQAIADHAEALLDRTAIGLLLYEGSTAVTVARGPVANAVLPAPREGGNRYPADDLHTMPSKVRARKRTVHLPDVQAHPDTADPDHDRIGLAMGIRTVMGVPLWRNGAVSGVILATRRELRPFADREIALVETFASQAAIALANADLLRALQERTAELTASVGRLTALFEVSGAVSATLDLDQVLATVVQRAAGLAGAEAGTIYVFDPDGAVFEPRANHGLDAELTEVLRAARLGLGEGPVGQAAVGRAPVQVPDLAANGPDGPARRVVQAGFRSLLAVPLLREQAIVGALVVRRKTAGEFPASTVELLQTFAAQSALAIQNARLFQELANKSQQLEEASRHKSEFLANMSHELRTPLNAIIGFTEVLLERYFGEVNAKQEDYLKDVLSSGQHLLALINDILDLSKVEAGRMELEVAPFDLGHALEAGLVMVKERASKKGIELALAVADDVGRVEADERKVKQVVFNLLTNAVKFTPEGGAVTVSARREHRHVKVAVADTGVGIAAEDLGKVFEEFGQAKNQRGQTEGTGLGLALVKRFVELHGGTVSVESEVERGSRFAFTLPVVQPART